MKKFILIFLFLMTTTFVFGQRDALYNQYLFNYHVLNPAFIGRQDNISFNLIDRHQWIGIPGAPNTLTLDVHTVLKNEKIALGGYMYADRLGPLTDFGVITSYAYIIEFYKGKLSLGLQFGFKRRYIDWDRVIMEYMDDRYLIEQPNSVIVPDANFGAYYYTESFFIGLSTQHLFEGTIASKNASSQYFSSLGSEIYLLVGGFIKIKNRLVYKPSILVKHSDVGTFSFDINSSILINRIFWVGISYRTNTSSFVFLFDININSKLDIGYSYDTYLGDIQAYNIGTHEIKLGYKIQQENKRSYLPVFF